MRLRMFGLRISALVLCVVCQARTGAAAQVAQPSPEDRKEKAVAEAVVRQRVQDLARAIGARDIDRVMSFYAPDIASFDVGPPLRYSGADKKRLAWQEFFAAHPGAVTYDVSKLDVAADSELAFVHSLNHVRGTLANGHTADLWVRWTACFRRIRGVWLIAHDHVSVPADLQHGQALLNLTP